MGCLRPLRLGALGPDPPGPLSKMALVAGELHQSDISQEEIISNFEFRSHSNNGPEPGSPVDQLVCICYFEHKYFFR